MRTYDVGVVISLDKSIYCAALAGPYRVYAVFLG
jgi:hypothetical protein